MGQGLISVLSSLKRGCEVRAKMKRNDGNLPRRRHLRNMSCVTVAVTMTDCAQNHPTPRTNVRAGLAGHMAGAVLGVVF